MKPSFANNGSVCSFDFVPEMIVLELKLSCIVTNFKNSFHESGIIIEFTTD